MLDKSILDNNLNNSVSYQEFFKALGYGINEKVFLRLFDDSKTNKADKGSKLEQDLGFFDNIVNYLKAENAKRRGVYFIVNGGAQTDKAVIKSGCCKTQFFEIDDLSFEEQIDKINEFIEATGLTPSVIIKTHKSLHCYFLLEGNGDITRFRYIQQQLITKFHSDVSIQNESRVMRVYGFNHCKQEPPTLVKLIKFDPDLRYSQDEISKALPPPEEWAKQKSIKRKSTGSNGKKTTNTGADDIYTEDGKIKYHHRHPYVVSLCSQFVNRIGDYASDESILALVRNETLNNCQYPENIDLERFNNEYLKTIQVFLARREAEKKDPNWYKYSLKAWKEENPGKNFDTSTVSWTEVSEAGERAKEAGKTFDDGTQKAAAEVNNHSNEYKITIGEELLTFQTGKWKVDANGVRQINDDGVETKLASRYPIIISHRLVDCETNTGKVVLTWIKEDEITSIPVERSIIASKQKIVDLSAVEFPVDSETARNLVTYLGDFEKLNGKTIGRKKSISKFGWNEKQFVPFAKDPVLALPPKSKLQNSVEISGHGDFDRWMELARKIRKSGRQEPLLYMAAALGSILVPIKAITPFIVDLYCPTGRGKTINMKFCASIWGNPSKLIKEATSTINALETILGTLNNIPLMIDDISKIQDDETGRKSTDMIYRLTAGSGKERRQPNRNEVEDTSTWSNIIITNMERPLETETMKGGALNRVLDFEAQDGDIFDDFGEVSAIVSENYGFFGRIFTQMVIDRYDSIKGIIEGYEQKIKDFAEKNGQQKDGKQIIPLAILLTADQLTEEYFHDGIYLDMKYCIDQLKDIDSISEMKRALEALNDEVITNRMNYVPDNFGSYRGKIYGKLTDDEIAITKSRFNDFARENNFSVKQFLNWSDKQGILSHDAGKKTRRLVLIANDKKQYCYVFKRNDIETPVAAAPEPAADSDGFINTDNSVFDELPEECYRQ